MLLLRVSLPYAQAQGEFSVEFRVSEEKVTTAVEPVHNHLIGLVAGFVAEADEVQWRRRGEFKTIVVADALGELLRQTYMLANVMLQPLNTVVTNHKP